MSAVPPVPEGYEPWKALAEALLIGTLIGAQREASKAAPKAGVREFILVAVAGAVCGLLNSVPLAIALLVAVLALWVVQQWRNPEPALTTGFALVVAFALAFLASVPDYAQGEPLAVGLAVVTVGVLEYKQQLRTFFRETLTDKEFIDTVRYLAMVLVIYPALPVGRFGPYEFFDARKTWVFVILVSTISYAGYFLEKFVGGSWSLRLTAFLGGLASTTATTTALARNSQESPERSLTYWQGAALANAVQFPRVLALVFAVSAPLAWQLLAPLAGMTLVGLIIGLLLAGGGSTEATPRMPLRNPFSLRSALRFGAIFAATTLLVRAVAAHFGSGALLATAGIAGLVDVDSMTVSSAELHSAGTLDGATASWAILLALAANAVFKAGIALAGGSRAFGVRMALTFAAMIAAGAVVILVTTP
jgi:uncharacterized membrane protein (DUF4010 family)